MSIGHLAVTQAAAAITDEPVVVTATCDRGAYTVVVTTSTGEALTPSAQLIRAVMAHGRHHHWTTISFRSYRPGQPAAAAA